MAKKTIEQFITRAIRLYEQESEEADVSARIELYVRRWVRWGGAGLGFTPGRHISDFGPPKISRPPTLPSVNPNLIR